MIDTIRNLTDATAQTDKMRDLSIDELEAVSGGCPCRPKLCDCDKPSPRIP
jgi:hypothetical protein